MKACPHCGSAIVGRGPQAKFCSHQCTLAAQSAARKAERKNRYVRLTCAECGSLFSAQSAKPRYCSPECRKAVRRRREAKPSDAQERVCPVCGKRFISKRYNQLYCDAQCKGHVLNARRIEKQRKTDAESRVSPELIAKRASVIREQWKDGKQPGHKRHRGE